jgi:hypothetical protein
MEVDKHSPSDDSSGAGLATGTAQGILDGRRCYSAANTSRTARKGMCRNRSSKHRQWRAMLPAVACQIEHSYQAEPEWPV